MIPQIRKESEERMQKALEVLRHELATIRTGKATTALLDGVKVDYYGKLSPLSQIGNVSVLDVHTLAIQPWDKSMVEPIQKAIQMTNLGLNPIKDGERIRVPIPPLNEERRRELVKLTKK